MASADILCVICDGQNITKLAQNWCPECEEGFCSECLVHHSISKYTKNHQIITVENYKKLPQNISSIVHHCKDHEKIYTNYCPKHECLCCPVCISANHNKCVDLSAIEDFIKTAKSSVLLESILEDISNLKENITSILALHDQNLLENTQYREKILTEVRNIRSNITSHLDKLEKSITQELSDAEAKIKLDMNTISTELRDKKQTIEELEHDTVAIKQYASDLQTCLGTTSFKDKVDEFKNYLISLQTEGKLNKRLIKCDLSDQRISFETALKPFGAVSITEIPLDFEIQENKQRAQIMSQPAGTVVKSINDINITLKCEWNVLQGYENCRFTGCVITSDGKIILAAFNYKNRVLILKENGELEKEIKFPSGSQPTDVTCVDDDTVCVSFWDLRLEMVDIVTYKTTQVIKTSQPCCGVTSDNRNLIWYEQKKGIQMKKKSNDTITTFVKDDSDNYWSYLTVNDNKIYQSHHNNHTITCYKMNGEQVWQFKDETVIKYPTGITVDNDSNVYVALYNDKVVILSPNGKSSRHILVKENELDCLFAIYFDKNRNTLLVLSSKQICMYGVS